MAWPIALLAGGALSIGTALVTAIVVTEESCAPARRSFLDNAEEILVARKTSAEQENDEPAIAQLAAALADVGILERNIATGWTTQAEAAALARVTTYASTGFVVNAANGVYDVANTLMKDVTGLLDQAFGFIHTPPNTETPRAG